MSTRLHIGNIATDVTVDELRRLLATCGPLASVAMVYDPGTGRGRGFAVAEMATDEANAACAEQLNGRELHGRPLRIERRLARTPPRGRDERAAAPAPLMAQRPAAQSNVYDRRSLVLAQAERLFGARNDATH